MLEEILRYNHHFVTACGYENYEAEKYPRKKLAILTCMDTRLVELLPAALGLRQGDIKLVTNAGAMIRSPYDSSALSLLIAVLELQVEEILVIGHTDCGVKGLTAEGMIRLLKQRGIPEETFLALEKEHVDLVQFFHGFEDLEVSVVQSVGLLRSHPLMPKDVAVHGCIMDTKTGRLEAVTD
ncbi:MAG: carbonic anhydrase [Lachnospiraceae bacterium]|nr:carbonic anhydrase [Lachnospiraceae bacterium]